MGFLRDASLIQARINRSPFAIALCVLVAGAFAYQFYWRDDPYRDGAEAFVRKDPAILQVVGDIRRVNLTTTLQGGCTPRCPTYVYSVVGTRAIVKVSVHSWVAAGGQLQFRILER
ncbi:MAG TPA: hypothetical protein VGC21_21890 [Telluria sp.]|jgi:hypothetical protein